MYKKIILFLVVIGLFVSSTLAGEDCPPVPSFVDCPGDEYGRIRACYYDTVYFQVKAVHPNADSARCIRYHLESGPGQVDDKTGIWSYFSDRDNLRRFVVEISASIGESGHRTVGDENCRFTVYLGEGVPKIYVNNLPYTFVQIFLLEAPGIITVPVRVDNTYNCGYTLVVDSVTPKPDGKVFIDENEDLVFKPTAADIGKRFVVELKAETSQYSSVAKVIFDTREEISTPVFTVCPEPRSMTYRMMVTLPIVAIDPEYGDSLGMKYQVISGPGGISYSPSGINRWWFNPTLEDTGKTFEVEIAAMYGDVMTSGEQNCRFSMTVVGYSPPDFGSYENNPCGKVIDIYETGHYSIEYKIIDDLHIYFFLADYSPDLSGKIQLKSDGYLENSGNIVLLLDGEDLGKSYDITLGATNFVDTSYCSFTVNVIKEPITLTIETVRDQLQGQYVDVDVTLDSKIGIGGFDFLIGYDSSAVTFMGANENNSVLFTDCGWEYFDYRFGPFGDCEGDCPSGQIRVVGIAEMNNGDYHPTCFKTEGESVLFTLKFLVSNDVELDCAFIPIRFYWYNCGDNTVTNELGHELYVSENVYDPVRFGGWVNLTPVDRSTIAFPTYEGAEESCVELVQNGNIFRNIDFYNGGIEVICQGDPDIEGDLDMDGLSYTLSDANVFRNYFLYGTEAFGAYVDGCIAATDVNYDNTTLTVEDFVWLVRVYQGDVEPKPDSVPVCPDTARFVQDNGMVTLTFDSEDSLGAVYLKFSGEISPVLETDSMSMGYVFDGEYTHVFIYNIAKHYGLHSGALIWGTDDGVLIEAATATYNAAKVVSVLSVPEDGDISIRVDVKEKLIQGQTTDCNVYVDAGIELGGFDFLMAFNSSAFRLNEAHTDSSTLYTDCGWEYFTYRTGPFANCDTTCPSGLVRIVGLAETNNGDYHPSCYNVEGDNVLFSITFQVTNDYTYECTFNPIQFYWLDCGDNMISDKTGNVLYVSNNVYDYEIGLYWERWVSILPDDLSMVSFPSYQGAPNSCLITADSAQRNTVRSIDFYNGGFTFYCLEFDPKGDLNMDGLSYNLADAVLFTEYFVYGLEVFEPYVEGAKVASDVNQDEVPLTLEDYILFIRIINGDAIPYPDINNCGDIARIAQNNNTVSVDFYSVDSLGVVFLKFNGEVEPVLEIVGMEMMYHYDSTYTNVIIYSLNAGKAIHSGTLLSGVENGVLVEAATATYNAAKVVSTVEVITASQFKVTIETKYDVIRGQYLDLAVLMNTEMDIGGFDFLMAYDASGLTFIQAYNDSAAFYTDCGWEYFAYRTGPFPDCGDNCPSGIIRIVGFAEYNTGDIHPSCFNIEGDNVLFSLTFLATNDCAYECLFIPLRFFWIDCGDNMLANETGYELYVSNYVYDRGEHDWIKITPDDRSSIVFPTYEGVSDSCLITVPIEGGIYRTVDFYNGGLKFMCADSIDWRGDLNMDGFSNTIADLVLFGDYFLYGVKMFEPYVDGAIAASDINGDGIPLTVEDYLLMARIVVGEYGDFDTIPVCNDTAYFAQNDGVVTLTFDSPDVLGAVYMRFSGEVEPMLEVDNVQMKYHNADGFTNVLILGKDFIGDAIHSVTLLSGVDDGVLVEVNTATYQAARVVSVIDVLLDIEDGRGNLPDEYSLSANYPNPFNPSTTIEFSLPSASRVELAVYNIRGQKVRTLVSKNLTAGNHTVTWNSCNDAGEKVASGVYLYRLTADNFTSVKKMMLLK